MYSRALIWLSLLIPFSLAPIAIGADVTVKTLGKKSASSDSASSGDDSRPNVILIVTDDQGYGDMSCHGNPWLKTPNLDRLAAESVRLMDYHVDPVCTPTRAALMTGRYCTRVGAWAVTEGRQLLSPDEKTMGDVFAASGYRTAMFGKWHLGDPFPYAPRFRGFQHVVRHRAGGVDEIGNPTGNNYFDDTYFRNGKPEKFAGYCTDIWFDETLDFIRQNDGQKKQDAGDKSSAKPFFVYLPLNAMHGPFTAAEKYWQPFAAQGIPEGRAKFYGMITNFDENLGRLLNTLQLTGREQNTIVIFMGDNGTAAGTNGQRRNPDGFNAGMRGKKSSVYEGGHRVACFVRWPKRLEAGRDVEQLTSHRDWMPTLIELCELDPPAGVKFDGQSIAPLLQGQTKDWPQRTMFVDRQADQLKLWNASDATAQYPQFAVLTQRWRLVNGELYDIVADPGQNQNVATKHPVVAENLWDAYQAWFDDVSSHDGAYTRFVIGAPQENPTVFTVRDWHPTVGRIIWKPEHLSDDTLFINGFWAIDVQRAGRYQFRLSRHPHDAEKPIKATQARIKLGDIEQSQQIAPEERSVTFELNLSPGPALLTTWLQDATSGSERGAYYVVVERIVSRSNK